MSTHNLCSIAKIRKKCLPLYTQFYYIKVGCKGVFITRTCFRDDFATYPWNFHFQIVNIFPNFRKKAPFLKFLDKTLVCEEEWGGVPNVAHH